MLVTQESEEGRDALWLIGLQLLHEQGYSFNPFFLGELGFLYNYSADAMRYVKDVQLK